MTGKKRIVYIFLPVLLISFIFFAGYFREITNMLRSSSSNFNYVFFGNYYLCKPESSANTGTDTKYPLLVFLHGSGNGADISYLDYAGYTRKGLPPSKAATSFLSAHPSFVLVPLTEGSWNTEVLVRLIEKTIRTYPIDQKRIYVIGYSMGGPATYSLANSMHESNGRLFAGIVRLTGQSQTRLDGAIVMHTRIWLHQGLLDLPIRMETTRQAYSFLKNAYQGETEIQSEGYIEGHKMLTSSLVVGGKELVKKTEYPDIGHDIVKLPFVNGDVIEWLFSQSLP